MSLVFDCMFMFQSCVIYLMYDAFHVCSLPKMELITLEYFNLYVYNDVVFLFHHHIFFMLVFVHIFYAISD